MKLIACVLVGVVWTAGAGEFPLQDVERVKEIAACLTEKPKVVSPLPVRAGNAESVAAAEKDLATAPGKFADELYLEFSRNGQRAGFERWRNEQIDRFSRLVAAESFERKGRFVPAIVACLDAFCAWPSWTLPAHDQGLRNYRGEGVTIDLFSSELARELAESLELLKGALPERIAAQMQEQFARRVMRPYLKVARTKARDERGRWNDGNWWFCGGNNWTAVCHSECVRLALAVEPDRRVRAEFIEAAERAMPRYLDGFCEDGYCTEGMGYWNYGYGNFLQLGEAVRHATGGAVDFFGSPKTLAVMRYPLKVQILSDLAPNYSDCGRLRANRAYLRLGCAIWPELEQELKARLPSRSEFPDGQVWVCRLGERSKFPFAATFKGGHNDEFHNHNDIGSYLVVIDRVFACGDPGGEVYTRRTFSPRRYESKVLNSYGHPVPVVDGRLQSVGRAAAAKVTERRFTDETDTVTLDLAAAYACPTLEKLTRTFVFDRKRLTFTVTDRVRFTKPSAFESPIVTYAEVVADYDPGHLTLVTQALRPKARPIDVKVSATGGEWAWRTELLENPRTESAKRLAAAFTKPVTEAELSFTFRP